MEVILKYKLFIFECIPKAMYKNGFEIIEIDGKILRYIKIRLVTFFGLEECGLLLRLSPRVTLPVSECVNYSEKENKGEGRAFVRLLRVERESRIRREAAFPSASDCGSL